MYIYYNNIHFHHTADINKYIYIYIYQYIHIKIHTLFRNHNIYIILGNVYLSALEITYRKYQTPMMYYIAVCVTETVTMDTRHTHAHSTEIIASHTMVTA